MIVSETPAFTLVFYKASSLILKIEAIYYSEKSVDYQRLHGVMSKKKHSSELTGWSLQLIGRGWNSVSEYCRDEVQAECDNGSVKKTRPRERGPSHLTASKRSQTASSIQ